MWTPASRLPTRRQRGFTLAEVVTTLGVLGVSASLVVPSLDNLARSNLRASTINDLVGTLHAARSEALTRNSRVLVCPSADGQQCAAVDWDAGWIRFTDRNGDFQVSPGETLLGARPAVAGFSIRSRSFARGLGFSSTGRPLAAGSDEHSGDFIVCTGPEGADPTLLHVNATGAPVLGNPPADGQDPDCA